MATDFTQNPATTTTKAQIAAAQQQNQQQQQAQNANSQAWLAANHPEWNQQSTSAAQAQQINQNYMQNKLPVLPSMAPNQGGDYSNVTFTAYDQNGKPYQVSAAQDAANEAAKHEAAFNPQAYYGFKYGDLANVPLAQIASMYGSNAADSVQGHFTQYPTANYLAITQQYNQQHQILQNPFPENTAAGIAWEVARTTGGTGNITESMKSTANTEAKGWGLPATFFSGIPSVSGRETVASPNMLVDYTNKATGADM